MALSVIGAGFGRTGTLSLRIALDRLGLSPCYHMLEVFEHPEHIEVWERAAAGERVDWEGLFRGYRSAVDWPVCAFYRELAKRCPEAKVILTVRDPERWYQSATETIFPIMTGSPAGDDPVALAQARMAREIIVEQTFGGRATIAGTPSPCTSATPRRCDGPSRRSGCSSTRWRRVGVRCADFSGCRSRRSRSRGRTRPRTSGR